MAQNYQGIFFLLASMTLLLSVSSSLPFGQSIFIKYHLCHMNNFQQNPLTLECHRGNMTASDSKVDNVVVDDIDENDGGLLIPPHGSYNWSFHPGVFTWVMYTCNAQWGAKGGEGGHLKFLAFTDDPKFVDKQCGGRHCIWQYDTTGVSLFDIKQQKYVNKYKWGPIA